MSIVRLFCQVLFFRLYAWSPERVAVQPPELEEGKRGNRDRVGSDISVTVSCAFPPCSVLMLVPLARTCGCELESSPP